jgi:hypothetical protein
MRVDTWVRRGTRATRGPRFQDSPTP